MVKEVRIYVEGGGPRRGRCLSPRRGYRKGVGMISSISAVELETVLRRDESPIGAEAVEERSQC